MQPDEITIGELGRTMNRVEATVTDINGKLEKHVTWPDLDRVEAARNVTEVRQDDSIKALEETHTWIARTLFGTLATALVAVAGMVLNAAKAAG